jgi:hypothetical protein
VAFLPNASASFLLLNPHGHSNVWLGRKFASLTAMEPGKDLRLEYHIYNGVKILKWKKCQKAKVSVGQKFLSSISKSYIYASFAMNNAIHIN